MKKMVCEICGSQSIKKENGVFICQECGTEYSLEEAKKLLIEVDNASLSKATAKEQKTENTNVNGKEELITQLYLWAKNLSSLQDMYYWFCESPMVLKNEEFWLKDNPFDCYEDSWCFPLIKNLDDNPSDISGRFLDNSSLKEVYNNKVKNTSGYKKMIEGLQRYSAERTNSNLNLHAQTAPKYRVCANDRHITSLEHWCKDSVDCPSHILDLDNMNFEIYYSVFSRWTGREKVVKATDVELYLHRFIDKCKQSKSMLLDEQNKNMEIHLSKLSKAKKDFNQIITLSKELEKSLFLPYEYRDINVVLELINMVRAGKATSWKELANLYDTKVFRENVINELSIINNNLNEINNTLIKGFTIIDQQLMKISSTLQSIDSNISLVRSELSRDLKAIKRNTFITMWESLEI